MEYKYIVVDEFDCTETIFDKFGEANKYALNIQGVMYRVDKEGNRTMMWSYAD